MELLWVKVKMTTNRAVGQNVVFFFFFCDVLEVSASMKPSRKSSWGLGEQWGHRSRPLGVKQVGEGWPGCHGSLLGGQCRGRVLDLHSPVSRLVCRVLSSCSAFSLVLWYLTWEAPFWLCLVWSVEPNAKSLDQHNGCPSLYLHIVTIEVKIL